MSTINYVDNLTYRFSVLQKYKTLEYDNEVKVKSAYEASGPSSRSLSQFQR